MSDNANAKQTSRWPQVFIAIVLLAVVLVVFLLPPRQQTEPVESVSQAPTGTAPAAPAEPPVTEPQAAVEPPQEALEPEPEITPEPAPAVVPEPVDTSDSAVKTAILQTGAYEPMARLMVDQELLRRFVVFTDNLANQELAVNHQVFQPPEQEFKVYRQDGKEWIDSASYKRYSPYVEALDAIDSQQLLALYRLYEPAILDIFTEISGREDGFDRRLRAALTHLLNTPDVPMPVEVSTESVMYKYVDPRLESLSAPQKQLLRTGPENMRIIKAKLREILILLDN